MIALLQTNHESLVVELDTDTQSNSNAIMSNAHLPLQLELPLSTPRHVTNVVVAVAQESAHVEAAMAMAGIVLMLTYPAN